MALIIQISFHVLPRGFTGEVLIHADHRAIEGPQASEGQFLKPFRKVKAAPIKFAPLPSLKASKVKYLIMLQQLESKAALFQLFTETLIVVEFLLVQVYLLRLL